MIQLHHVHFLGLLRLANKATYPEMLSKYVVIAIRICDAIPLTRQRARSREGASLPGKRREQLEDDRSCSIRLVMHQRSRIRQHTGGEHYQLMLSRRADGVHGQRLHAIASHAEARVNCACLTLAARPESSQRHMRFVGDVLLR